MGPLQVTAAGEELAVGAAKERAVLAVLALRGGRGAGMEELMGAVWGDDPPRSAHKSLHKYVSALRRVLPDGVIETVPWGYRLRVAVEDVDVAVFERLVAAGRRASHEGDLQGEVGCLVEALGLWRGDALVELADQSLGRSEAVRLGELRRSAEEDLAQARLNLGEHAALVGGLESAVAAEPLRERRWAQLMVALYRCGRQAEALRAYQRLRTTLSEELGIDPRAELVALEAALILQKPELVWTAAQPPRAATLATRPSAPVPAALMRASRRTLIGRETELDRLARSMANDASGVGVVLVAGEPGIGKTRLAAAAASLAAAAGALVLFGRCDEGLRAPYQPFVEALASYVTAAPPEALGDQLRSIGGELSRLLPGLADRVAGLGQPTRAAPETERWLLFEATAHFLRAVAAGRPVLLVIDDLQWAEPATLLLLRHLARGAIEGLMIVATARTAGRAEPDALADTVADLASNQLVDIITIGGLSAAEVEALVADRLERPPSAAFAQAVHAETGGNAFFVHELVSHLSDTGVLQGPDGAWPTGLQVEQSGAPEGVRHVLSSRLAHLSASAGETLVVASVAGGEFHTVDVAGAVGGDLDNVIAALEEAAASGLIAETAGPAGGYRFAHALVRHTLYESVSALRRAQLHWRVAEAIRASAGPRASERLNDLAYHYRRGFDAGDTAVALEWLHQAGDQAVRQLAFEEAIEHYQAALAALDRCPDDPDCRYHLLAGVAETSAALSDFALSKQAWVAAAHIAKAASDSTRFFRAVRGYGTIETLGAPDATRDELMEQGLELAGPGDSAQRAKLLAWRAAYDPGLPDREEIIREALAMARRLNDHPAEISVLAPLGWALLGSSKAEERLAIYERVLQLTQEQGYDWNLGIVHGAMAGAAIQLGRRPEAEAALERGETMARAGNRRLKLHVVLMLKAAMAIAEGRFAEAKRWSLRSATLATPTTWRSRSATAPR